LTTLFVAIFYSISLGIEANNYHIWKSTTCKTIKIGQTREFRPSRFAGVIYFYSYVVNYKTAQSNQTQTTLDDTATKFNDGTIFPCLYDSTNEKKVMIHHVSETALPQILIMVTFYVISFISCVCPIFISLVCLSTFKMKSNWNFKRIQEIDMQTIAY
jgi:hypothetical protein